MAGKRQITAAPLTLPSSLKEKMLKVLVTLVMALYLLQSIMAEIGYEAVW